MLRAATNRGFAMKLSVFSLLTLLLAPHPSPLIPRFGSLLPAVSSSKWRRHLVLARPQRYVASEVVNNMTMHQRGADARIGPMPKGMG